MYGRAVNGSDSSWNLDIQIRTRIPDGSDFKVSDLDSNGFRVSRSEPEPEQKRVLSKKKNLSIL